MEEEIRAKANALNSANNKIIKLEENHSRDVDQLNGDIAHFKSLYEEISKRVKNSER